MMPVGVDDDPATMTLQVATPPTVIVLGEQTRPTVVLAWCVATSMVVVLELVAWSASPEKLALIT